MKNAINVDIVITISHRLVILQNILEFIGNVRGLFQRMVVLKIIWRHILGRNHINAVNVIALSDIVVILKIIWEPTLGRNYINAVIVIRLSHKIAYLQDIWEYTLEWKREGYFLENEGKEFFLKRRIIKHGSFFPNEGFFLSNEGIKLRSLLSRGWISRCLEAPHT